MSNLSNITDIKNAYYINLEKRTDRKIFVEDQLTQIGIKAERFNAIQQSDGALGCSMSHLKCIENAKENNWDHVLVVEDDIKFLNPNLFVRQINKFLKNHKVWDVILIAGNNYQPFTKIEEYCVKVTNCQTTTGYIVNSSYYDKLIENYREGINNLMKEPNLGRLYCIDQYWSQLQEKDLWYLITPLSVTQREDYSDIEKSNTNYISFMTNLYKEKM